MREPSFFKESSFTLTSFIHSSIRESRNVCLYLDTGTPVRNISYWRSGGNNVMIKWMDREYTDASSYYREVVLTMPREKGVILGALTHIEALARLTQSGLYIVDIDDSDIYVDDWRVNGSYLTHKHPEFGIIQTGWTKGMAECDVLPGGKCDICEKQIPGEIEMMHHFYKLDG